MNRSNSKGRTYNLVQVIEEKNFIDGKEVVERRYEQRGTLFLRADKPGGVVFLPDGTQWAVFPRGQRKEGSASTADSA